VGNVEAVMSIPTTREEVIALVEGVAEALPGEWDLDPHSADWNWGGILRETATGAVLNFSTSSYRDASKMTVRGVLPSDARGEQAHVLPYGQQAPSINVSASKTPAQVARDVEQRLMPRYLPLLERALAQVSQANAHYGKSEGGAQQIARLLQVEISPGSQDVSFYHSPLPRFSENLGQARVRGDEVDLELRLDLPTALRVLSLLADPSHR
jgi:hypothetical protein